MLVPRGEAVSGARPRRNWAYSLPRVIQEYETPKEIDKKLPYWVRRRCEEMRKENEIKPENPA